MLYILYWCHLAQTYIKLTLIPVIAAICSQLKDPYMYTTLSNLWLRGLSMVESVPRRNPLSSFILCCNCQFYNCSLHMIVIAKVHLILLRMELLRGNVLCCFPLLQILYCITH